MATTKTLPDNKVVTMPAYNESADIAVINTDLSNIADNIILLNNNKLAGSNTLITTDTDFNTLTKASNQAKWYYGAWRSGHTNGPPGITEGHPFTLEVLPIGTSDYSYQKMYVLGLPIKEFTRGQYYNNNVLLWTSWESKIIFEVKTVTFSNGVGTLTFDSGVHLVSVNPVAVNKRCTFSRNYGFVQYNVYTEDSFSGDMQLDVAYYMF